MYFFVSLSLFQRTESSILHRLMTSLRPVTLSDNRAQKVQLKNNELCWLAKRRESRQKKWSFFSFQPGAGAPNGAFRNKQRFFGSAPLSSSALASDQMSYGNYSEFL